MAYSPYDWRQTLQEKADYVEDRLRGGSPVIALSCREGVLLLTLRGTQRKLYELYERLAFGGLGNPSDLETIRQTAIDFCHAEGFQRSPEDVSIQRVVGFALSPVLKRGFADPLRAPLVLRGLFAQVGEQATDDLFYKLNYDGEFSLQSRYAGLAGAAAAERQLEETLSERLGAAKSLRRAPGWQKALPPALRAWAVARWQARQEMENSESDENSAGDQASAETLRQPSERECERLLAAELEKGSLEAALLERETARAQRFRLLSEQELAPLLPTQQG